MKYIDAEKLKRFEEMLADIIVSSQGLCTYEACKDSAKIAAPVLIGSLQQEQPQLPGIEDPGIPGKDFIPVEWVDACEMYGKWKIVRQEQPEVGLEEVYDAYCKICGHYHHTTPTYICRHACDYFKDFEALLNARKEGQK